MYALALYVEAERAARELGVRKRGGFFDDNRCPDIDPLYVYALIMMVIDVTLTYSVSQQLDDKPQFCMLKRTTSAAGLP